MKTWLIRWDIGYGENYEEIEAENFDDALEAAYEAWRDDAESNANYRADEMTGELRQEYFKE